MHHVRLPNIPFRGQKPYVDIMYIIYIHILYRWVIQKKLCLSHPLKLYNFGDLFLQAGLSAARVAAPFATVSGSTVTVSGSGSSDAAAAATQALVVAEGRRQLPLDLKQLLKLQRLGPCHCMPLWDIMS